MMKSEFEQLVGCNVGIEDYAVIEAVYTTYENLFPDKQSVADFYRLHGCDAGIFNRLLLDIGNSQLHCFVRDMRMMYNSLSNIQVYAGIIQQEIEKVNSCINTVTFKNLDCLGVFSERSEKS